ncbi:unnamed protein product [Leptosia nina]|uniref:Sulfotransferase domain-containing protein n=1 Tax=Leptosia nina TaxID=320188 RepID=A0AAV1J9P4_9NEOP
MANKSFPYEIKQMNVSQDEIGQKYPGLVSVGPKGFVFPENYRNYAEKYYNLEVRPSDVFVFSFPRSGTTWTQELVWLVVNDLDYKTANKIALTDRYQFLEYIHSYTDERKRSLYEQHKNDEEKLKLVDVALQSAVDVLPTLPSPRFIKSHLPLSLLPPNSLDAKLVYVARDPRDCIVSYYHFTNSLKLVEPQKDFKVFWNAIVKNLQPWTPFFENVKEAWEQRHHPNLLFIFYEDLRKDLLSSVRRVCDFFGKKYSDEQLEKLCDHLRFENFRKNTSVDLNIMKELGLMSTDKDFVRKGMSGGWRDYFDEEMTAVTDKWIADNLRDTDLRFPSMQ